MAQCVCVCGFVCVTGVAAIIDWSSHVLIHLHRLAGVSACQPSCHCHSSHEGLLLHPLLVVLLCWACVCVYYSCAVQLLFSSFSDHFLLSLPSPSPSALLLLSAIFSHFCFRPYLNWAGPREQSILPDPCRCVFCVCWFSLNFKVKDGWKKGEENGGIECVWQFNTEPHGVHSTCIQRGCKDLNFGSEIFLNITW